MRNDSARQRHFAGRTGVAAIVLVLVAGSIVSVSTAPAAQRPNILFAISDDQSYPYASAYGSTAARTPAFDRVARQGVLFTQAFVPSPGCSPCRASLLTGRYPWQLEHAGTHNSQFLAKFVTFPDLLEGVGYFVGYTGKGWGPGNWQISGRTRNPAGREFSRIRTSGEVPRGVSNTDYADNFEAFLDERPKGAPFCFWYGGHEPHRRFEQGIGLRSGKKLEDVKVPPFLPDTPEIRSDLLDYCVEIEWFDRQLGRMLDALKRSGELERTLVIVTSDNGMAFPRAKANCYEYGIHVPLAIRWPAKVSGERVVDDLVSFVDLTATLLDVAGVEHPSVRSGEYTIAGRSLLKTLVGRKSGLVDRERRYVFSGRERHSSSRHNNLGYPQRAIRSQHYLLIRNFKPDRWPAGAPQKFEQDGTLGPMHGAYHDIDAAPSLDYLVKHRDDPTVVRYFRMAVARRPAEELYDIRNDPGCLKNLVTSAAHEDVLKSLRRELEDYLRAGDDPRMGPGGDVFESYRRFARIRRFPEPGGN